MPLSSFHALGMDSPRSALRTVGNQIAYLISRSFSAEDTLLIRVLQKPFESLQKTF